MINANSLSTGITILSKHAVETGQAVGPALPHDVPLAAQVTVTLETGKVLHVPGPSLGLCALVREDYLKKNVVVKIKY